MIKIDNHYSGKGYLSVLDLEELPFTPVRSFWVYDVPKNSLRGNHAHYKTHQLLICLKGKIESRTFNGDEEKIEILSPGDCLYIKPMIWDSQKYLTGKDLLLVFCSTPYARSDYILDFHKFIEEVKKDR